MSCTKQVSRECRKGVEDGGMCKIVMICIDRQHSHAVLSVILKVPTHEAGRVYENNRNFFFSHVQRSSLYYYTSARQFSHHIASQYPNPSTLHHNYTNIFDPTPTLIIIARLFPPKSQTGNISVCGDLSLQTPSQSYSTTPVLHDLCTPRSAYIVHTTFILCTHILRVSQPPSPNSYLYPTSKSGDAEAVWKR